jgi:hypothetical protein
MPPLAGLFGDHAVVRMVSSWLGNYGNWESNRLCLAGEKVIEKWKVSVVGT